MDPIDKLAALMTDGFHDMKAEMSRQFGRVGEKFERVEKRLEHLETDARDLKEGVRRLEYDSGEMKEELHAVARAVDSDAETIISHETRIKKLEHVR